MTINSALLTDFYQLTMSYGYWRLGMANQEAVFHLFFRKHPFKGNYTIIGGIDGMIEYVQKWQFKNNELDYLSTLVDSQGKKLFSEDFLNYLGKLRFTGDIHAMPAGQLAFPEEPVLRIRGPILQCQLLETALLNQIGFASLVTTKAARVCHAAGTDPVLEFGLRRAQGPDGGMTASHAAFIGGCESVSNTLAAMQYHIPPRGTMAHSWVMAFDHELTAFTKFAEVMAGNAVLLVDTYDTLSGVKNAIKVGKQLREKGHELLAIRLDSGDLYELSRSARQLLDDSGFQKTKIMASGDLDEYEIARLKQHGAPINVWGVGTRLSACYDQPALDCAYKLSAIRNEVGEWNYRLKRSDLPAKTTNPGIQQVRRFFHQKSWIADVIYDVELGIKSDTFADGEFQEDLLLPIFRGGQLIYHTPSAVESRAFCKRQLETFLHGNFHEYPIRVESRLQAIKDSLLAKYKEKQ